MEVTAENRDGIALIQIDDGKKNAITPQAAAEILAALEDAEANANAIVLAGRPGSFCAGFELETMTVTPRKTYRTRLGKTVYRTVHIGFLIPKQGVFGLPPFNKQLLKPKVTPRVRVYVPPLADVPVNVRQKLRAKLSTRGYLLKYIYQRALKLSDSPFRCWVRISLMLQPNGRVSSASVAGGCPAHMVAALKSRVRLWRLRKGVSRFIMMRVKFTYR